MPESFTYEEAIEPETFSFEEAAQPEEREPKEISPDIIARGLGPSPITGRYGALGAPESGGTFQRSQAEFEAGKFIAEHPGEVATSAITAPFSALAGVGDIAYASAADIISRLAGQPEYGGNIAAMQAGAEKLPVETFLKSVAQVEPTAATVGKLGRGAAQFAPAMGMAALPAWANRLIAAGFSAKMISDAPEVSRQLGEEFGKLESDRDLDKITTLISEGVQIGAFAPLAAAGALSGLKPKTSAEAGKIKETQNAIQRETEKVLQPLREQPREGPREMPAAAPSEEVGRRGEPPAEEAAPRPAEPSVLLSRTKIGKNKERAIIKTESGQTSIEASPAAIDDIVSELEPRPKPTVTETTPPVAPEEMQTISAVNVPLEQAKGRLRALTEQFNRPRTTKREKAQIIKDAEEARKSIIDSGGTPDDIQQATYGTRKPLPRGSEAQTPAEPGLTPGVSHAPTPAISGEVAATPTTPVSKQKMATVGTRIGREGYVWEKLEDGWYSRESDGTLVRRPKVDAWAEKQVKKPDRGVIVREKPTPQQIEWLKQIDHTRSGWNPKYRGSIYPTFQDIGITKKQFNELKKKGWVEDRGFGPDITASGKFESDPEYAKSLMSIGPKETTPPTASTGEIGPGPGAMTAGEQPPSAIQQLADRLRATPPVGQKETVALRDKVSDKWAEGKTLTQRALGKLSSLSQSLKDTARGVRAITDLDRRVAGLDWELQQSIGRSQQAGRAMAKQMKDANQRRAVAIYMDTPGGEAAIRAAIPTLPANTPRQIRKAVETAANLTPEMKQFSEDLRSFFGMREQDAKTNEIFEHGLEDYFTHIWRKEANMPDSVRAAISNGRVNDYFQFARKRTIGQLLEGIAAGKVPELDPAKVIPHYNYVLDRAIASRMFIKDLSEIDMPDERPAVLPTGVAIPVERGGTPEALIIDPKRKQQLGTDYRLIDHPALRKWKWAGTDENGNPVLYRSDLSVHPDSYERLARIMDRGRLTPTEWGRRALRVSTEVKGFKLGLLSAFHQVHVGSHALFHWTLPFNLRNRPWLNTDGSINYDHPFVQFAVEKGHLKIAPDPGEIMAMSEGLASPGLLHKVPIVGPWSKAYSEWTFGRYIPKLKVAIMENAYNRALWMRDKLGAYKGLSEDQIAARIGDSVNNALGELNNLFLGKVGRDPRFQRLLRGIFLAPDFGEARLRFAEKALTRYGHEERIALATMFATLYLGARIGNWLSHGDPEVDKKRMFQVKIGNHWWSMRSVLGDLHHAITDFGQFMYVRLNPLYARTASDWLFGRDPQGRKISLFDKAIKRPLEQLVPIQLGALTRDDQRIWESFVTAMGVQTRKDRPEQDIGDLARTWMKSSKDPKLEEKLAVLEQEVFPPSRYAPLKNALRFNDEADARKALAQLRITHSMEQIDRAMKAQRPFTGSLADEKKFLATLTPKQRLLYRRAVQERQELYRRFRRLLATPTPRG